MEKLLLSIVAILSLGISFWISHGWDRQENESPRSSSVSNLSELEAVEPSSPMAEMVTTRSLIDAGNGLFEPSHDSREHLRFGDWTKQDPRAAFAAAVDHEDNSIASTVITSIAEFDPHLALELSR